MKPFGQWILVVVCVGMLCSGCSSTGSRAAFTEWGQYRGPNGSGHAVETTAPLHASDEHIAWKSPLPAGYSSPILWGNRVFVTALQDQRFVTLALDRTTGELLWKNTLPEVPIEPTHATGHPVASTPFADADHVYVYFGSYGLIAYTHDGDEAWSNRIPLPDSSYGMVTSPIGYENLIYLTLDSNRRIPESEMHESKLVAYERMTGEVVWETPRPFFRSAWTTPTIWETEQQTDLVVLGARRLVGYDPITGAERWFVNGFSPETVHLPVEGDGVLFASTARLGGGYDDTPDPEPFWQAIMQFDSNGDGMLQRNEMTYHFNAPWRPELPPGHPGYGFPMPESAEAREPIFDRIMDTLDQDKDGNVTRDEYVSRFAFSRNKPLLVAIKPGGSGNITDTHIAWEVNRNIPEVPSPLYYNQRVYMVRDGGVLACHDATTGEQVYRARLPQATGQYSVSPILINGHVVTVSCNGVLSVIEPGDELGIVHQYDVGEQVFAVPAVDENTLYIRTTDHLIALRG